MVIRYGIADAYGIETYLKTADDRVKSFLFMRAELNRQRHAVFFTAKLSEEGDKKVSDLLDDKKFDEALVALKSVAQSVWFPKDRAPNYEESWRMIPDAKLDPYK